MQPAVAKAILILAGAACLVLAFTVLKAEAGPLTTTGIALLTAGGVTIHDTGHVEALGVSAKVLSAKKP